jgi:hypothetical protein
VSPGWAGAGACDYRPPPMPVALTAAQAWFVVALLIVALIIVAFALYVLSSVFWADRWVRRRP